VTHILEHSKIRELLTKEASVEARKSSHYLHSNPEDMAVMKAAVESRIAKVYFPRRNAHYTITYLYNDVNEACANFQPVKGFVPCGTYVIHKLFEGGYV